MDNTKEIIVHIKDKATMGPPLAPQLSPYKFIKGIEVVREINDKIKDYPGMRVPVQIIIHTKTTKYEVIVKKPVTSDLLMRQLKIQNGSALPGRVKGLHASQADIEAVAREKFEDLFPNSKMTDKNLETACKIVKGTARSMGYSVSD